VGAKEARGSKEAGRIYSQERLRGYRERESARPYSTDI
jgi:hypothetical protein